MTAAREVFLLASVVLGIVWLVLEVHDNVVCE